MTAPVLLVEDNPDDVLLFQRAFLKKAPEVILRILEDGAEAIKYLSAAELNDDRGSHPLPLIILLDLKLPGKSGLEVLEWIKSHQRLKTIPVVMLTSSREESDIERAYSLGANSFLVKPVEYEEIVRTVASVDEYWIRLNKYSRARRFS